MDLTLLERLMQLLEQSSLTELDLTENGVRIRLSKRASPPVAMERAVATTPNPIVPQPDRAETEGHVIVAGLAGTFYRAPLPGEAPFVTLGERVTEGKTLGIVEAMKMMNPIEADCDGVVTAIHLGDAMPVEAGQALFTIRPEADAS